MISAKLESVSSSGGLWQALAKLPVQDGEAVSVCGDPEYPTYGAFPF
jgi:hypothetical protein